MSFRGIRPFQPFPTDALPEPAREFVCAVSESSACDPSYVALPLLAVLASAIGNSRRIQGRPSCFNLGRKSLLVSRL